MAAGNILADLRKADQFIGLEDALIAASAIMNQYIVLSKFSILVIYKAQFCIR